jgi:hypothetical protein
VKYHINQEGEEADDITESLTRYAKASRIALKHSFKHNKEYFDRNKSDVEYEIGDNVYVEQKYLVTDGDLHNKGLRNRLKTKFVAPRYNAFKFEPCKYFHQLEFFSKVSSCNA